MTIYLDFEGQPTPIEDLLWVGVAPCGCYSSGLTAESGPYLTAEAAKMEHAEGSRVIADRDPDTYILVKRGDPDFVAKFTLRCPHTPAYGRDNVTLPDTHEWARAGSSRIAHAVLLTTVKQFTYPSYRPDAEPARTEPTEESSHGA